MKIEFEDEFEFEDSTGGKQGRSMERLDVFRKRIGAVSWGAVAGRVEMKIEVEVEVEDSPRLKQALPLPAISKPAGPR